MNKSFLEHMANHLDHKPRLPHEEIEETPKKYRMFVQNVGGIKLWAGNVTGIRTESFRIYRSQIITVNTNAIVCVGLVNPEDIILRTKSLDVLLPPNTPLDLDIQLNWSRYTKQQLLEEAKNLDPARLLRNSRTSHNLSSYLTALDLKRHNLI